MIPNNGIEISLKPIAGGNNRVLPHGINQVLQQEYAAKYLENIGANPTKDNIDFVLNNLSIKDALVMPVWAREKIVIIPGMNGKQAEYTHMMQDSGEGTSNTANKAKVRQRSPMRASKNTAKDKRKVQFTQSVDDDADSTCSANSSSRNLSSTYSRKNDKRKASANSGGRKLSWATVHTLDLLEPLVAILKHHRSTAESFKTLLAPPLFAHDDLLGPVQTFVASLVDYVPQVKNDASGKLFKAIRKLLTSDKCIRLFGLLCHFCYWNSVHPAARATVKLLKESDPQLFDSVDATSRLEERITLLGEVSSHSAQEHNALLQQHLVRFEEHGSPGSRRSMQAIDELFDAAIQRDAGGVSADCAGLVLEDDEEFQGGDVAHGGSVPRDLQSLTSTATEASLNFFEKEQLYMQLETCLAGVFSKMGSKKFALVTSRQALISCAHFVVDDILTTEYPWFSSLADKNAASSSGSKAPPQRSGVKGLVQDPELTHNIREVNLRLRRLVHQSLSDIIDPSRLYTSSMLLSTLVGSAKVLSSRVTGKAKYYGTSAAIKAVLGDTTSDKVRRFFQRGTKLYSTLPGVVDPYEDAKHSVGSAPHDSDCEGEATPALLLRDKRAQSSGVPGHTDITETDHCFEDSQLPDLKRAPTVGRLRARSAGTKQRLDFNNLFSNQPAANYFPDSAALSASLLNESTILNEGSSASLVHEASMTSLFPTTPLTAAHDTASEMHKTGPNPTVQFVFHDTQQVQDILRKQSTVSGLPQKARRLRSIQSGVHVTSKFNPSLSSRQSPQNSKNPQHSAARLGSFNDAVNNTTKARNHQQQMLQYSQENCSSSNSVSSSLLSVTDNRSVAFNESAKVQLSLKAKASLMGLVVGKASSTYAGELQTSKTVMRMAMINNSDELF